MPLCICASLQSKSAPSSKEAAIPHSLPGPYKSTEQQSWVGNGRSPRIKCHRLPVFFFFFFKFFFFNNFYFYFYLFMAVVGLRFCARAPSSCGKRGPLFIAVRGPLTIAASLVAEHRLQMRRLSNWGSRAQLLCGMCDLPRPGLEPVSPALAGRLPTTAPPGKPPVFLMMLSFSWMNASQLDRRLWSISKILEWLFLTALSDFIFAF